MLTGTVTAAVAWSPGPEFLIAKAGDKLSLPLTEPLARSREAIAVRKGDHDLLAFLNAWIRYQQDADWLTERRKYWFGGLAWEEQL